MPLVAIPRSTLLAPCLRAAAFAAAGLAVAFSAQAQSASALPAWKGEGATRHVCGGIGSDESKAMRAAMKSHPLALLFARSDGAYMADVQVEIKGADGATALSLRADGPVCLVDIPAGRYTIDATTRGGDTRSQTVTVGSGSKTASFRF